MAAAKPQPKPKPTKVFLFYIMTKANNELGWEIIDGPYPRRSEAEAIASRARYQGTLGPNSGVWSMSDIIKRLGPHGRDLLLRLYKQRKGSTGD
jgi:hypothetical protein